jgi:hypothetical protein
MSKKRKRAASLSHDDIVFVFLSAKLLCGNRDFMGNVQLGVGFAPKGLVAAKLHASNNSQFALQKPSWKILFGFHCTVHVWKKHIKGSWSRCVHKFKEDWESSVREGLKLAYKYCEDKSVYISNEAKSYPSSPMLECMQRLCRTNNAVDNKKKFRFWKLVLSKKNKNNLSNEIAKNNK